MRLSGKCGPDAAGAVLWSKAFTPTISATDVVNRVVREAFLEERTASQRADFDGYTVRWTFSNVHELAFIVRL